MLLEEKNPLILRGELVQIERGRTTTTPFRPNQLDTKQITQVIYISIQLPLSSAYKVPEVPSSKETSSLYCFDSLT